jgi:hypothetical protein
LFTAAFDFNEHLSYAHNHTLTKMNRQSQENLGNVKNKGAALASVFLRHLTNPFHPAFIETAKHPEALTATLGEVPVNMKLQNTWRNYTRTLTSAQGDSIFFDQTRFEQLLALMDECGVKEREQIRLETLITVAEKQKNWEDYMQYVLECTQNPDLTVSDLALCRWCGTIATKSDNGQAKASELLKQRIDDLDSGRRQPQTREGNMILSGNLKNAMLKILETMENPI